MCYHISNRRREERALQDRFDATFEHPKVYQPYHHFNGWESKNLYIIRQEDPESIDFASWGLLPTGYDLSLRSEFLRITNTLNATRERLFESQLFNQFIHWQRCLIIADGFYEPHKDPDIKGSVPFYFQLKNKELFALAGVYSVIDDGINPLYSASIITTEANPLFKKIHNSPNSKGSYRMPLILNPSDEYDWLHSNNDEAIINTLLHTFTKSEFETYPVSQDIFKRVDSNRPDITNRVDYPELKISF
ncbi:Abasic site processing protein [Tenacibaculum sp. 190130A14a]|uniref:Abasic site processing protein n=1 Tax=Tenacibaculum polynesiense TaxID=3137857 RepID=A0ABM9PFZ3_9FLAO